MKIDRTKCDRCGFEQTNPTPFIGQATIKLRRPNETLSAIDVSTDWCVKCFDDVQRAVTAAMAKP